MKIPRRQLGGTGEEVTLLGLGGEGVLRTFGQEKAAYQLINRAIDLGVTYFESARAYAGSEAYYGLALRERRREIFLTSKSHARDREGAWGHLQETLANMKTDYLDLWQVHDVRTAQEVEQIFGRGGALEAFVEARAKGLVRYIGVTGHHDTAITLRCMERFDFDTVLIPVNPAETDAGGFADTIIPVARERGMGIVAMKTYFRGMAARIPAYESMEPFFRFALSQPVSTAVIGCDSVEQLQENVGFAISFTPMMAEEKEALVRFVSPYARQLMYYKPQ